jgi:hypothetical protein
VEPAPSSAERSASASVAMAAATISNFAASANRSLTIGTMASDNTATNIRVGNTGVAQHFPQLAASCAQGRTEHAELKAKR